MFYFVIQLEGGISRKINKAAVNSIFVPTRPFSAPVQTQHKFILHRNRHDQVCPQHNSCWLCVLFQHHHYLDTSFFFQKEQMQSLTHFSVTCPTVPAPYMTLLGPGPGVSALDAFIIPQPPRRMCLSCFFFVVSLSCVFSSHIICAFSCLGRQWKSYRGYVNVHHWQRQMSCPRESNCLDKWQP